MKENRMANKSFLPLIFLLTCLQFTSIAQNDKNNKKDQKIENIKNLIASKNFVFVAQYASPLGGRQINLTSMYDLRLSPDTLVAELPYYGRAFVAPIDPSQGGINFTSTNFLYNINQKKKGGWDISISPKDNRDVRQMFLTVTEDGYGSLVVTSNNRQNINFSGYVTSKDKAR